MNLKIALLSAACALALSACGGEDRDQAATQATTPPPAAAETTPAATQPATPTPAATTPAATPAAGTAPAAAGGTAQATGAAAPAAGSKVAVVNDCATEIESNDAIQYNVNAIVIPASCTEFTITMKHVGKLPVAAMGHNVVITTQADMQAVVADGMAAGLEQGHLKPNDERVIAHSEMIGGGETTEVTFPVSKLQGGGPFKFFCSFPGHSALMNGSITVE